MNKKLRLGEIRDSWSHDLRPKYVKLLDKHLNYFFNSKRRIKKIKKSIIENGYNPEKYGHITVFESDPNTDSPYRVIDGNHRIRILKELYGHDHEITIDNVVEDLEECTMDAKDSLIDTPIMYYPPFIFFTWYMLLQVIVFSVFCYCVMAFIKDTSKTQSTDIHPIKRLKWVYNKSQFLYEVFMNIYYNFRNIILVLAFLWYLYYMLSNYFYGLMIMTAISMGIFVIFTILDLPPLISLPGVIKKIKK